MHNKHYNKAVESVTSYRELDVEKAQVHATLSLAEETRKSRVWAIKYAILTSQLAAQIITVQEYSEGLEKLGENL